MGIFILENFFFGIFEKSIFKFRISEKVVPPPFLKQVTI